MRWTSGDLEDAASDVAHDRSRDVVEERRKRDEAWDRERRFRQTRDEFRQHACCHLLVGLPRSMELARRFALAAERVELWRHEAFMRGLGGGR